MPAGAKLSFHEMMGGGFVLGESDPAVGAEKGRSAGARLEMHATVVIDDLRRFVADPDHSGRLEGHVRFPPLGDHLPATAGLVRLFSRPKTGGSLRMVYQMGFTAGSRDYYLAGEKFVGQRNVLHAWRETTTLFTWLHEGRDADGAIVGAGVLKLTAGEFAKQLISFRAPGASVASGAGTMLRFGTFFAGQLLRAYF